MVKPFAVLGNQRVNYTVVDALQEFRVYYITHSPRVPRTIHQQVIDHLREIETLLTPYYPRVVLKDEEDMITVQDLLDEDIDLYQTVVRVWNRTMKTKVNGVWRK